MSDSRETEKTETSETGTSTLLMGGGVVTYGTTLALTAGYICPVCVVAAPLLLGYGGYQKYKYHTGKLGSKSALEDPEA